MTAQQAPDSGESAGTSPVLCRIVIETNDAGGDFQEAVAWLAEWAQKVTTEAPFAVEHVHVEAIADAEALDV